MSCLVKCAICLYMFIDFSSQCLYSCSVLYNVFSILLPRNNTRFWPQDGDVISQILTASTVLLVTSFSELTYLEGMSLCSHLHTPVLQFADSGCNSGEQVVTCSLFNIPPILTSLYVLLITLLWHHNSQLYISPPSKCFSAFSALSLYNPLVSLVTQLILPPCNLCVLN